MHIAITGASGHLGRLVIQSLQGRIDSSQVIALARTPERIRDLGVAAREADYTRPDTLEAALAGVERLLLISSNEIGQRAAQHLNVIEAARRKGVKAIVYTSLLHADRSPLGLAAEHRVTEEALRSSGIPFVILRNGWYCENYTGSIPGALAHGAFVGSAGEGQISAVPRADYAEAAAVVLAGEGHEGRVYELAGDSAFTLADLAAELSRQVGRQIPYRDLPEAEYAAVLKGVGLPDGLAHAIASWDVGASQGALFDEGRQLSALIGRPTTPLSVAVAAAL